MQANVKLHMACMIQRSHVEGMLMQVSKRRREEGEWADGLVSYHSTPKVERLQVRTDNVSIGHIWVWMLVDKGAWV